MQARFYLLEGDNSVILLLTLILTGCAKLTTAPVSNTTIRDYPAPSSLSTESFRFIGPSTSVQDMITRIGKSYAVFTTNPPYDEIMYFLRDGTSVTIETDGGSRIFKVKHGQTILFEQPR
jgi:hypothetical protein